MSTHKPAQFTPGPYELRGSRLLTDSNGVVLADNIGANWPGTIEGQANLFAAAPAMYAALREAEKHLTDLANYGAEGIPEPLLVSVRSAIAQAEGRQA